jgi:hypothetical protein
MIASDISKTRDSSMHDSYVLENSQLPGQNPLQINDQFLATERAACASLEMRLRSLAEKAASRSTYTEKQKSSQWHQSLSLTNSPARIKGKLI